LQVAKKTIAKASKISYTGVIVNRENNSVPGSTPSASVTKIMLRTLVSTTVRIFAPTLGLFAVGAVIDFNLGYKPYGMIIGTSVGIVIAAILILMQIRKIKQEKNK